MTKSTRRLALLLLVVACGVTLRAMVRFKETPDCAYHLRRARFALLDFPKTIIFDPTMNFPAGGICIWPPLFDVSLAVPSLPVDGRNATVEAFERRAAWVPVGYAAGAILGAALAGLALRRRCGWAAGLFVALCPGHLQYSQHGHVDQHVAESCWGFLALAALLALLRKRSRLLAFVCGVLLGLAVLTWQGSIFWAPLFALALCASVLWDRDPVDLVDILLILGIPPLLAGAGTWYWLSGFRVPFTYVSFGWFQPVFLCAVLAGVLALHALRRRAIVSALLAVLVVIPVLWKLGPLSSAVVSGVQHLASASQGSEMVDGGLLHYPKEWLAQIQEYHPLLSGGWRWSLSFLSIAFFLSPLVFLVWALRMKARVRPGFHAALLASCAFIFLFTLSQRRNVYYAALVGGLATLELGVGIAARLRRRIPLALSSAVVMAALALPMLIALPHEVRSGYEAGPDRMGALLKLRELLPAEFDMFDLRMLDPTARIPELAGARSVLAFWSQGHLVTYYAERPVVANNFGYAFLESLRFFFAEDEGEALAIARAHNARFVLSVDVLQYANDYGRAIGRGDYLERTGRGGVATPAWFRTLQARMHDFDGEGATLERGVRVEPLVHFKLRYASRGGSTRFGRFVPLVKVFEIVD